MNYSILLYECDEGFKLRSDPVNGPAYAAAWPAYTKALIEAGVLVTGAGLQVPETATTLRMRDGTRQVQDGPYADTKEQLGGFYIIDVPDLDTALDWAARAPVPQGSAIEVRPVIKMPDDHVSAQPSTAAASA